MRKFLTGAIASLALLTTAAIAEDNADKFYNYEAGQWLVEGFKGELSFCAATTFWKNDSYVSFFVTADDTASILVHNTEWNIGDPAGHYNGYKATLRFFGKYPGEQGTIDYTLKDTQTVVLENVNVEFLKDWVKFDTMVLLMPGDIGQMTIGLSGTSDAVDHLGECLNQLSSKPGTNL